MLLLTAAAEEGADLAGLEHALKRQSDRVDQIVQEAHIEFARARMALERALRETAELAVI